jgi:hypothetical protein
VWNGWSDITPPSNGAPLGRPIVISMPHEEGIDVIVGSPREGSSGDVIWRRTHVPGVGSAWSELTAPAPLQGPLAAVSLPAAIDVFARRVADGALCVRRIPSNLEDWVCESERIMTASAADINYIGQTWVVALDEDGAPHKLRWDGSSLTEPESPLIPQFVAVPSGPSQPAKFTQVVTVSRGLYSIDAFALAPDGKSCSSYCDYTACHALWHCDLTIQPTVSILRGAGVPFGIALAGVSSSGAAELWFWLVNVSRSFAAEASELAVSMAITTRAVLWIVSGAAASRGAVGMKLAASDGSQDSPAGSDWWWMGGEAIDVSGAASVDSLMNERLSVVARSVQGDRLFLREWRHTGWVY